MLTTWRRALAGSIRRALSTRGVTVRAAAKLVGRPHSSLSMWQTGQHVPSRTDLVALLDALAVSDAERTAILEFHRLADTPEPGLAMRLGRDLAVLTGAPPDLIRQVLEILAAHCDSTSRVSATTLTADDLRDIAGNVPTN